MFSTRDTQLSPRIVAPLPPPSRGSRRAECWRDTRQDLARSVSIEIPTRVINKTHLPHPLVSTSPPAGCASTQGREQFKDRVVYSGPTLLSAAKSIAFDQRNSSAKGTASRTGHQDPTEDRRCEYKVTRAENIKLVLTPSSCWIHRYATTQRHHRRNQSPVATAFTTDVFFTLGQHTRRCNRRGGATHKQTANEGWQRLQVGRKGAR